MRQNNLVPAGGERFPWHFYGWNKIEGTIEWEGYLGGIASNDLSLLRLREANYVEKGGGMCAVS